MLLSVGARMGKNARAWAKRQRTGGLPTKAVLLLLADYANDETGEAWPAIRTLADEADSDPKCVHRQLAALETLGLIRKKSAGSRRRNVYVLALDVELTERSKRSPRRRAGTVVGDGPVLAHNLQSTVGSQPTVGAAELLAPSQHDCWLGDPGVLAHSQRNSKGTVKNQPVGPDRSNHQTREQADQELPSSARGSRAVAEALNATAHSAEARGIIRKWSADHDEPLPQTIYTQLARQIDTLRDRGATGAYVWAALLAWDEKRAEGEKPRPGLLPYLHDQIKLDGLAPYQLYATPVEYLRDEDIDVFEVLGYDSHPPEAPDDIENGPFDIRHDWYAKAIKQRHHERCIQAREVITRRQAMRQTVRESA